MRKSLPLALILGLLWGVVVWTVSAAPSPIQQAPGPLLAWQNETADSTGAVGRHTSLTLDTDGQPHISYYDHQGDALRYASIEAIPWYQGPSWQIETVDASGGQYTSLALDATGQPRISYCSGNQLKYAAHNGSAWSIEAVDTIPGSWCEYTSLALDATGRPHIAYYDANMTGLKYALLVDKEWQIQIVDKSNGVGKYASLALDADAQPHVSYYYEAQRNLRYATYGGKEWQTETVDSDGDVGKYTSLALNEAGRPHISNFDGTHASLRYAAYDGAEWQKETVDQQAVGEYTSLALAPTGSPHIAYYASLYVPLDARVMSPGYDLMYAYHDGSSWQIETVDSGGDVGKYASLALDMDGQRHVSYFDDSHDSLKYASTVPLSLYHWAAQHLEDARGTSAAPGWESAQLGSQVQPFYRPDVEGVAYYEFPVVVPASVGHGSESVVPAGYIMVSTGDHDVIVPHWDFDGSPPSEWLKARAEKEGHQATRFYELDAFAHAAENEPGEVVAVLGQLPLKLTGLEMEWLDDPPPTTSIAWVPDRQPADDSTAAEIGGTRIISGPATIPAVGWSAWPSWGALKAGYGASYSVLLEALHRDASEEWQVRTQISREGEELYKGDLYSLALIWPSPVVSTSGGGANYVQTELLSRPGLPPALRINVLDSLPGERLPLAITIDYPNGTQETVPFQIVGFHTVWLPLVLRNAIGEMATFSAPGTKVHSPQDGYSPYSVYWVANSGDSQADQRWYDQIPEGLDPNTSECLSGCGATAWAMLFGWADYQASLANPYWEGRWGLFRVGGGYGADDVAPRIMFDYDADFEVVGVRSPGVVSMTWEIRTHIKTLCPAPSAVGPDPGYTEPWDMRYADQYVTGRSCTRTVLDWSIVPRKKHRDTAIRSIRDRGTPAIILNRSMNHYPLAYGYRVRCWRSAVGCLWRDHDFYVNLGWGSDIENSGRKWVSNGRTHLVGQIVPCSDCVDDVAVFRLSGDKWFDDYGHDGTIDQFQSWVTSAHQPVAGDFDSDGHLDDVGAFYPVGVWLYDYDHDYTIGDEFVGGWGQAGDLPVAGDFDRDGFVDDIAVYRPSTYHWLFDYDHDGTTDQETTFGCPDCQPVAGDFDRDGFADDVALYRFTLADQIPTGKWYYDHGHTGINDEQVSTSWGTSGALPLAGDFDCDGQLDDVGLFDATQQTWSYDHDHDGTVDESTEGRGLPGDLPVVGAFDREDSH